MDNKLELEVSKNFDCPVAALYEAWTAPGQLQQWWRPLGKQLTNVENDLREGGIVKYAFDDEGFFIDGTYEKVFPAELLEYSWQWHLPAAVLKDSSYKLSVHFEEEGTGCRLTVKQQGFQTEESIQPHRDGWNNALEQLSEFVSGNAANSASAEEAGNQGKPAITGYNETPEQLKVAGG